MALRQFVDGYYKKFIPKSGVPNRVYKYAIVNDNLKNSLANNYLWFSKPGDFNDPFDCWTALVDFSNPGNYLKKLAQTRLTNLSRHDRRSEGRKLASDPAKATKVYHSLLNDTRQMMGVCCFTLNNDHILMWSHYAHNHRGICLEFEPMTDPSLFLTAEVIYTDEVKPLNYFSSDEDALMIMTLTKSTVWSYEREIRIMRPMENGKINFLRPALKGIIFGCRTSEEDIKEIQAIVAKHGYRDIIYRRAVMAKDSFKLVLENF